MLVVATLASAALRLPAAAPRAPVPRLSGPGGAKTSLLTLIDACPHRGIEPELDYEYAPPPYLAEAHELAAELEPLDPSRGDWMVDPAFERCWRLRLTTSATFRRNGGLNGFAGVRVWF